jgi:hypothetical protein
MAEAQGVLRVVAGRGSIHVAAKLICVVFTVTCWGDARERRPKTIQIIYNARFGIPAIPFCIAQRFLWKAASRLGSFRRKYIDPLWLRLSRHRV